MLAGPFRHVGVPRNALLVPLQLRRQCNALVIALRWLGGVVKRTRAVRLAVFGAFALFSSLPDLGVLTDGCLEALARLDFILKDFR